MHQATPSYKNLRWWWFLRILHKTLLSRNILFDSRSQYIQVNIIRLGVKRWIVSCNSVCIRIRKEELTYENRNMSHWERHEVLKISIMKKASTSSVNWSNNIVNHKIIITKQSNLIGNKTISLKENEEIPSRTMEGKTNGRKLLSMFIILSLKKVALMTDIQGNVIQKWSTEIITQSIKINSFRHIRMNIINAIHISTM